MQEIEIKPKGRWEVVFREADKWQCGIYVPEFTSIEEITWLEKHDAPELFYLVRGSVVLVLSPDGKEIREVPMREGVIYVVDEWHNAYRPRGVEGIVLVIERVGISTQYLKLK